MGNTTNYIEYKDVVTKKLTCTHPKVNRIWEWGGGSINPTDGIMHRYISILLNGEKDAHTFKDEGGEDDVIKKADLFLQTLPIN